MSSAVNQAVAMGTTPVITMTTTDTHAASRAERKYSPSAVANRRAVDRHEDGTSLVTSRGRRPGRSPVP